MMLRQLRAGALGLLVALAATACDEDTAGPGDGTAFRATLTGHDMMPNPVTTAATGAATFTINDDASTIDFVVTASGLIDANAAFLYVGAPEDLPGTPVAVLLATPVSGVTDGQLASGTIAASAISGGETFTSLVEKIRAGNAFVVVQTIINPEGELRGQLEAQ